MPSAESSNDPSTRELRWYQGVPRYAWLVLIICAMGWLFDTMDQHLFNLVRSNSVRELLEANPALNNLTSGQMDAMTKSVGSQITAVFLLGWAAGGFLFGMVGDRLGRARTMVITILCYAIFTGLNALVRTPTEYMICRFLTAMGVGGEFAAGAALVAETWPARSRPMALGLVQSLSAVGNMSAAVITYFMSAISWRYVFVVGAIPALLVVWIQLYIKEPDAWLKAREKAKISGDKEVGSILQLFREKDLRRNTFAGMLLAIAGVCGFWGVGVFMPDLIASACKPIIEHWPSIQALGPVPLIQKKAITAAIQVIKSKAFFLQMFGGFFGMYGYALLSQRVGRKPSLAIFLLAGLIVAEVAFNMVHDINTAYIWAFPLGFCGLAPFSAFAVYFPELYPTRLRATGVGFCYNCARILAAGAVLYQGVLVKMWADPTNVDDSMGLRKAASVVALIYLVGFVGLLIGPETKGKPLPE